MQLIRDERRFMLLLALALLTMLGFWSLGAGNLDSVASDVSPPEHDINSPARSAAPGHALLLEPHLRSLLASSFAERFPTLAEATASSELSLGDALIVSYYGNPNSPPMGILGKDDPETIAALLERQAERYDELNGPQNVVPALHLVYSVAQPHPAADDTYLYHVDDSDLDKYIAVADKHNMLFFLDLQIGRSSVEAEVRRVLPYLRHSNVHLALDPEFAMGQGQVPGVVIGGIDGKDVNRAEELLQELVEQEGLPPKILVVHQFVDSMIRGGDAIRRYSSVELVIDIDGFGPGSVKRAIYRRYATRPYAFNAAIKLFFQQDTGLLSEEDVLALDPSPTIVIYQ
ncbi:MAG: hypothetical protein WBD55_11885 [Dehalococcoidia bacterium]